MPINDDRGLRLSEADWGEDGQRDCFVTQTQRVEVGVYARNSSQPGGEC